MTREKAPKQCKINLGYCQGGAPLLLQNVEAYATVAVDVWVKNFCPECNLQNFTKKNKGTYLEPSMKLLGMLEEKPTRSIIWKDVVTDSLSNRGALQH